MCFRYAIESIFLIRVGRTSSRFLWFLQNVGSCPDLSVTDVDTGSFRLHSLCLESFCGFLNLILTSPQPPPSFLATMEDYVKEAPQTGYVLSNKQLVRSHLTCSTVFG